MNTLADTEAVYCPVCGASSKVAPEHDVAECAASAVAGRSGWTRCPSCRTSGTPHERDGEECREAALERSISQADE